MFLSQRNFSIVRIVRTPGYNPGEKTSAVILQFFKTAVLQLNSSETAVLLHIFSSIMEQNTAVLFCSLTIILLHNYFCFILTTYKLLNYCSYTTLKCSIILGKLSILTAKIFCRFTAILKVLLQYYC